MGRLRREPSAATVVSMATRAFLMILRSFLAGSLALGVSSLSFAIPLSFPSILRLFSPDSAPVGIFLAHGFLFRGEDIMHGQQVDVGRVTADEVEARIDRDEPIVFIDARNEKEWALEHKPA